MSVVSLFTFLDRPVGGSLFYYLDPTIPHLLTEASAAVFCRKEALVTPQLDHMPLLTTLEKFAHLDCSSASLLDKVGANVGGIQVFRRLDAPVLQDDDLAGSLGFPQRVFPTRR